MTAEAAVGNPSVPMSDHSTKNPLPPTAFPSFTKAQRNVLLRNRTAWEDTADDSAEDKLVGQVVEEILRFPCDNFISKEDTAKAVMQWFKIESQETEERRRKKSVPGKAWNAFNVAEYFYREKYEGQMPFIWRRQQEEERQRRGSQGGPDTAAAADDDDDENMPAIGTAEWMALYSEARSVVYRNLSDKKYRELKKTATKWNSEGIPKAMQDKEFKGFLRWTRQVCHYAWLHFGVMMFLMHTRMDAENDCWSGWYDASLAISRPGVTAFTDLLPRPDIETTAFWRRFIAWFAASNGKGTTDAVAEAHKPKRTSVALRPDGYPILPDAYKNKKDLEGIFRDVMNAAFRYDTDKVGNDKVAVPWSKVDGHNLEFFNITDIPTDKFGKLVNIREPGLMTEGQLIPVWDMWKARAKESKDPIHFSSTYLITCSSTLSGARKSQGQRVSDDTDDVRVRRQRRRRRVVPDESDDGDAPSPADSLGVADISPLNPTADGGGAERRVPPRDHSVADICRPMPRPLLSAAPQLLESREHPEDVPASSASAATIFPASDCNARNTTATGAGVSRSALRSPPPLSDDDDEDFVPEKLSGQYRSSGLTSQGRLGPGSVQDTLAITAAATMASATALRPSATISHPSPTLMPAANIGSLLRRIRVDQPLPDFASHALPVAARESPTGLQTMPSPSPSTLLVSATALATEAASHCEGASGPVAADIISEVDEMGSHPTGGLPAAIDNADALTVSGGSPASRDVGAQIIIEGRHTPPRLKRKVG
ncbi:hypothetical protein CONPUDRAFT_73748 [Coniophora puteana RWD-64-598 SS2]|uniref:Uncharacterized protein n=1 Tax=Coniophora puteana (strain RWD-64-598) TaxID=741705 RepID=A0A5M3MND1_CONPW|nr:uncharacterized protein CONPUDRAFT_73748 [Coniophora puteana RWD-64-598 SS2]EIW80678.1 hypothetical protein CONPUDRAFT_73748 [Coniophora puteana RWD-64-598 SS2]